MRTLPADFAARLASGATTLAHAYVVTRTDGTAFGFTDHDRPLAVGGVVCEPGSGLDRSGSTRHAGLAVGEEEIAGALSSDAVTETDLAAGVWDGAEVAVHLVDWLDPAHAVLLRRGRIGEVVRADGGFRAEVRGPAAALDRVTGRRFLATCDAELGDARCRFVLGPLQRQASVAVADDARRLVVSGVGDVSAGHFTLGRLAVDDGPMAGATARVEAHLREAGATRLVLRRPLPGLPAPGTQVTLSPGCDKHFGTCRDTFANSANFRGFPHVPGRDAAFSYARDGGRNDGGPLGG